MTESEKPITEALAALDRVIPKYCTAIQLGVFPNKSVVMSMFYSDGNASSLIERVVLDHEHVKKIHGILTEILEKQK